MKICFYETHEVEKNFLQEKLCGFTLHFSSKPLLPNSDHVCRDAEIISISIESQVTKKLLDEFPQVKYILTRSTGYDNIDVVAARKKRIKVSNIPNYATESVAEFTLALILALSRKIIQSSERTEKSDFSRTSLTGFDLKEKTIGIVGYGNIGKRVASLAHAFGMSVMVYDVSFTKHDFSQPIIYAETLSDLLKNSDIITLHVPYSTSTHHLINQENIRDIKQGSLLINTARGGIIDTKALLYALDQGILQGAGIDVLEPEANLDITQANRKLIHYKNVIITPHNAFNSQDAIIRMLQGTVKAIYAYRDNSPLNLIEK